MCNYDAGQITCCIVHVSNYFKMFGQAQGCYAAVDIGSIPVLHCISTANLAQDNMLVWLVLNEATKFPAS